MVPEKIAAFIFWHAEHSTGINIDNSIFFMWGKDVAGTIKDTKYRQIRNESLTTNEQNTSKLKANYTQTTSKIQVEDKLSYWPSSHWKVMFPIVSETTAAAEGIWANTRGKKGIPDIWRKKGAEEKKKKKRNSLKSRCRRKANTCRQDKIVDCQASGKQAILF